MRSNKSQVDRVIEALDGELINERIHLESLKDNIKECEERIEEARTTINELDITITSLRLHGLKANDS